MLFLQRDKQHSVMCKNLPSNRLFVRICNVFVRICNFVFVISVYLCRQKLIMQYDGYHHILGLRVRLSHQRDCRQVGSRDMRLRGIMPLI